ncbi:uncharacterized protein DDB_G0290301 isoform X2 [Triplophysa rosa]|uniref:uncharacterized protein DDB_G0290301 isoform X2 n=1 Tax=Triplophysa rosa TaxID=992332 RepID=UPI002545D611|nr:uncharacterized protein DDB_G0290301 isoform X2 [Triplophysa rosa]
MVLLWKVSFVFFYLTLSKLGLISCVLYFENGKSLILDPDMKGTPEDILWTFNGNKLAEQDLNEFQDYGQFVKRTEIDIPTGRLRVHRMTRDDSGFYKAMIQIDGKLQYFGVDVEVIDGVPEPQVTCELNSSSQSRQLFCSMPDEIMVTYTWTGPDVLLAGQTLEIDKDEPSDSVYICTVKNPVSQKSNSIILKDCITDGFNLHPIIIPLVTIGVILIAGALALVMYLRCWRNKSKQMSPEEKEGVRLLESTVNQNQDVNQRSRDVHDGEENREQKTNEDEDLCEHNDEGAVVIIQETDGNISEQEKEDDVQTHESDVHDGDENREQQINEDEGTLNDEGAVVIIQETDGNISEQKKEDDVQSESEQTHESESSEEGKDDELEMSSDRRESVDTNEQTDGINKDKQSENCSDEHRKELNERNFQDQSEQIHDSANDSNQSIRDEDEDDDDEDRKQIVSEHREDFIEEEEGNTDESADENITEKRDRMCVKDMRKIFENQ